MCVTMFLINIQRHIENAVGVADFFIPRFSSLASEIVKNFLDYGLCLKYVAFIYNIHRFIIILDNK